MADRQEIARVVRECLEKPVTDATEKVSAGMEKIIKASYEILNAKTQQAYQEIQLAAKVANEQALIEGKRVPVGTEAAVKDAADGLRDKAYENNEKAKLCQGKHLLATGNVSSSSKAVVEKEARAIGIQADAGTKFNADVKIKLEQAQQATAETTQDRTKTPLSTRPDPRKP